MGFSTLLALGFIDGIIFPDWSERKASSAFRGSAPITRIDGEIDVAAIAVPLKRPPPPTGRAS